MLRGLAGELTLLYFTSIHFISFYLTSTSLWLEELASRPCNQETEHFDEDIV